MQVEECKTSYKKDCHIETVPEADTVPMEVCHYNYLRDCDSVEAREGPQECTNEYDTGSINMPLFRSVKMDENQK